MPAESSLHVAFTALLALTEQTRAFQPRRESSDRHRRSYAPWSQVERQLLQALQNAEVGQSAILTLLERSPEALRFEEKRSTGPTDLASLPRTSRGLTAADVHLLAQYRPPPVKDPLGWFVGQPLGRGCSAPAGTPTLRILRVRPDPAFLPGPPSWPDLMGAVRATQLDLAALLCARPEAGLAYHRNHALHDDLRRAVERAGREAPLRKSVRPYPLGPQGKAAPWAVAVVDRPEEWPQASIQELGVVPTLILVLPDLAALPGTPVPKKLPPLNPPSLETLRQRQEQLIRNWRDRRDLEVITLGAVPNSHETHVRLDWRALAVLPHTGRVMATRDDLLVRASAWYQLATGHRLPMPDALRSRFTAPSGPGDTQAWLEERVRNPDVPLEDRVLSRVLLDLFSPDPAVSPSTRVIGEALTLERTDQLHLTYIGR